MSAAEDSSAKAAKVAIPRLKRSIDSQEGVPKGGGRHRVTHACEPCRHRKTKCSGERPMCRHCQDFKIACYYADGKRDRVKKQFGSMTEKVAEYEKVLKELLPRVAEEDARRIRKTLDKAAQLDVGDTLAETATLPSLDGDLEAEASGAESEASAGVGSTGALDRTEEDFTREEAKITGFMGKNSEVTWIQRLRHETRRKSKGSDTEDLGHQSDFGEQTTSGISGSTSDRSADWAANFSIHDASYHLDDLAVTTFEAVDPYELPTPETAQMLFNIYLNRVYPQFPIVGKVNLQNQFQKFLSRPTMRPPPKWLAILNMIFAISAKYSHFIQAEWRADERDHLIYFSRARLLAIDGEVLFNHPDLQVIQILALMSLYLLCVDQINRSWTLVGVAIRYATALGLNMRNESSDLADSLKEIRYRVWWSLYVLEHRLCSMTGRVNCIIDEHCTAPLPVPVSEEDFSSEEGMKLLNTASQRGVRAPTGNSLPSSQPSSTPSTDRSRSHSKPESSRSPSTTQIPQADVDWAKDVPPNTSLFFLHLVQLFRCTQNIFQRLYNPSSLEGTWSDIQARIANLDSQLESWYRRLPAAFDFRRRQRDRDFYEHRLALGFYYYSTKQLLHRPCLCRLDRKIPGQSAKSMEFNHAAAIACVNAAQELLQLIPDEPNAVGLMKVGPWMSILHVLVQTTTILMLEISFRAHHMPEQAGTILEDSKKAIKWLHALGDDNLAAARAWHMCYSLLRQAVAKIGRNVDDLPSVPPRAATSPSADTNMSNSTAIHRQSDPFDPSFGSAANFSQPSGVHGGYAPMNPLMQFDQMLPGSDMNSGAIQFSGAEQTALQYSRSPTAAEMEFMSTMYHNEPQGGHGDVNTNTGGRPAYR